MTGQHQLERRVLTALICEPAMWFSFDAVELADFTNLRHRIWFTAFRWLQTNDRYVDVLAILDRIEATDREFEKQEAEIANGGWLGLLILHAMPYRYPTLAMADGALLHHVGEMRRAA
jgi:hypothetical protein